MLYTKLDLEDTKRTRYVREPCVNGMKILNGSLQRQCVWMSNWILSFQNLVMCSEQKIVDILD